MDKSKSKLKNFFSKASFVVVLFFLSFAFLSFFSCFTTPFSHCDNGGDAAFFRLVGQGMTKGYLPYRDFFDMKGPLLFFIEYLGQIISYGRLGIFLIQCINLFLVFVLITSIFKQCNISNYLLRIILLLPVIYIASFSIEGGNLTEELSLCPLFLCFFLCLIYFDNLKNENRFFRKYFNYLAGFCFGLCFGLIAMIRITNGALICALVISVIVCMIKDKKYLEIIKCAVSFILGLIVSIAPFLVFYASKGLLTEMLNAVFVLGIRYSSEKSLLTHISESFFGENREKLLLIFVPCIIVIISKWRGFYGGLIVVLSSIFTFWAISSGNNYTHYYTLVIPIVVLSEISLINLINEKGKRTQILAASLLMGFLLTFQYGNARSALSFSYNRLFNSDNYTNSQTVKDISDRIPAEDEDSVFCYNIDPAWYTYADLFPCIKYCGWQNHYISLMPEIYDELEEIFDSNPPTWLVLSNDSQPLPQCIENKMGKEYLLTYENEKYKLYYFIE